MKDFNWTQVRIIHCPITECKGMLLECDESYDLKCSDCKKRFYEKLEYVIKEVV